MTKKDEQASAMLVQKHQLDNAEAKVSELDDALEQLLGEQEKNQGYLDQMLDDMDVLLSSSGITFDDNSSTVSSEVNEWISDIDLEATSVRSHISMLSSISMDKEDSWETYFNSVSTYAQEHSIDLENDPFDTLLSPSQKVALEKKIKEEFSYKNAKCDKYDYLIAVTCGMIGGLIDIFFVGAPGEGKLSKLADGAVDKSVESFAKVCGWNGAKDGSDPTKSAIGFLERKFKVNYDQATTFGQNGTGGAVNNLSASNHHLKSLGHSPDLFGLFFSILNQFTNTSSFVSNGRIITIDTEDFNLQGYDFISKVFCGFANWLGHLFSDMAGSSGASGRGSGIPIPFYNFLLLLEVGEFGKHKQTFATIATKVFEQGYDLRHGLAMAIPVLITELLTRLMWVCKQRFYHHASWNECIPKASNPELRRMLLVAHGSLCIIDTGGAAIKSGGEIVQFLLRTNVIGWVRFGTLAYKEVIAWHHSGHIDPDAVDQYLDEEYKKILYK